MAAPCGRGGGRGGGVGRSQRRKERRTGDSRVRGIGRNCLFWTEEDTEVTNKARGVEEQATRRPGMRKC